MKRVRTVLSFAAASACGMILAAGAPASKDARSQTQFRGLHAGAVRPAEHVRGFLWLEAENFETYGDWEIDTQFTHKMGSAYLICPGLAVPRTNCARTVVTLPRAGVWHVWVTDNDRRYRVHRLPRMQADALRVTVLRTWGTGCHVSWRSGRMTVTECDRLPFQLKCDCDVI